MSNRKMVELVNFKNPEMSFVGTVTPANYILATEGEAGFTLRLLNDCEMTVSKPMLDSYVVVRLSEEVEKQILEGDKEQNDE